MPLRKFRDPSEMEHSVWCSPGEPRLLRRMAYVWGLAQRLAPQHFPPGALKHRTIEDLNRQTEAWSRANHRSRSTQPDLG